MLNILEKLLSDTLESLGILSFAIILVVFLLLLWATIKGKIDWFLIIFIIMGHLSSSAAISINAGAKVFQWLVMLCMSIVAIGAGATTRGSTSRLINARRLFLLYVGIMVISISYSEAPAYSVLRSLYFLALFPAMYIALSNSWDTPAHALGSMRLFVALGIILIVLLLPVMLIQPSWAYGETGRFRGFYRSSGSLAGAVAISCIFMLWFVIYDQKSKWKGVALIAVIVGFVALLMSTRRGTTYMFALAALILISLSGKRILWIGVPLVIIASIVVTNAEMLPQGEFISRRFSTMDPTGRTMLWRAGWNYAMERPFRGHGTGAVEAIMMSEYGHNTHMSYLNILGDLGFPGLLLGLSIMLLPVVQALKVWRHWPRRHEMHSLSVLCLALILSMILYGFVESGLNGTASILATMVFLVAILADKLMYWHQSSREALYTYDLDDVYSESR